MGELNRGLEGGDRVEPRSFVSVSPPAGISPLAFLTLRCTACSTI